MFADCNGLRLHYDTRGDHGTPVLLIMGFTVAGAAWRNQHDALAAHHRVAWFDNRGSGRTALPPGPCGMAEMAGDAVALLDHLGWPDAHVTGVSMGGMIAQELALRHRARVRSLTLITTSAGGWFGALPTWRGALQLVRVATSRGRARLEAHRGLLFPASWAPDPEPLYAGLEADYGTPPDPAARRAQLRAILRHDTRRRLHELAGLPTLVVRGGADILIRPSRSDALHAAIPGARLLRIDEAGHGLIRQTPGPLNAALLEHYRAADEALGQPPSTDSAPRS